jgi:tetrathionate reductase subunit B
MSKAFVIDVSRCSGCYNCQVACKDEHCGNDWRPYAAPQPDTGQFWMHIDEHIRGTVPKVKMHYLPHLCNHCKNAPCMKACPQNAFERRPDGLVLLGPDKCAGCKKCMDACPYGVIFFNEKLNIAQKCTGCAHLLDHGNAMPRCAEACPTGALSFGEEAELKDLIARAAPLKPESGCSPSVWYLGIPGLFIAGTVYDPAEEVIVKNAECVLTGGGRHMTVVTDGFGDFWFKDLNSGVYDVTISAPGFAPRRFVALDLTGGDLNLGDIPLGK